METFCYNYRGGCKKQNKTLFGLDCPPNQAITWLNSLQLLLQSWKWLGKNGVARIKEVQLNLFFHFVKEISLQIQIKEKNQNNDFGIKIDTETI